MSVARFTRAPHRAIYVWQRPDGQWIPYIAGYTRSPGERQALPIAAHATLRDAWLAAREASKRCGIPIAWRSWPRGRRL